MEDGFVVSKRFANDHKVPDAMNPGQLRPLKIGDKMLDRGGNKGVISIIVDPDKEINEEDPLFKLHKVFKYNPGLDVIASPYSGLSRFNGATARELMSTPHVLKDDDVEIGQIIGEAQYIITRQFADKKTKIYTEEDYVNNRSRKASPQLSWALCSKDAENMLKYFYGSGERAMIDTADAIYILNSVYCNTSYETAFNYLLDISISYVLINRKEKQLQVSIETSKIRRRKVDAFTAKEILSVIKKTIIERGYEFDDSEEDKLKIDINEEIIDVLSDAVLHFDAPICYSYYPTVNKPVNITFIPLHLRPGFVDDTGRTVEDDITEHYRRILKSDDEKKINDEYEMIRNTLKKRYLYDVSYTSEVKIDNQKSGNDQDDNTDDIKVPHLTYKKENLFKSMLMTHAVKNSATAIWTPDPRLGIGSVAVSEQIADKLKIMEDDYVLLWRDPVLRDSNVRYMKVSRIDSDLTGVAINPVVAKSFDGDFDGDTVAVVKIYSNCSEAGGSNIEELLNKRQKAVDDALKTVNDSSVPSTDDLKLLLRNREELDAIKAHKEAIELFAITGDNNIFDDGKEAKVLIINTGMDIASYYHQKDSNPFLKPGDLKSQDIDVYLSQSFADDYFLENAMIDLKDDEAVIRSFEKIINSGAKKGDIKSYQTYFEGKASDDDRVNVQIATAIKAAVGIAGRYSQQLMRGFRGKCPKAVLELTYPNTQALLQIKHNPSKAKKVFKCLRDDLMKCWREETDSNHIKETYENILDLGGIKNSYFDSIFNESRVNGLPHSPLSTKIRGYLIDECAYGGIGNNNKKKKFVDNISVRSLFSDNDNPNYFNGFTNYER
ncbi:MAG: hypothetical protein IKE53_09380 [Clostridiales bacterium]|nr:hypothetical protein [Clostridiales bacterium]